MFFKVFTTIAVTVAVFVLAAHTTDPRGESDGIAIPLTKRSDTDARKSHATSHDAKIIDMPGGMDGSERNTGTLAHTSAVQRDMFGDSLDLTRFANGIWYGTISIGTPPKSFTVQLNTGTSDLFIAAATGDETCRSHTSLWNPAHSSQITNSDLYIDFKAEFADGRMARGKQYTDNVTIAGFTADRQTIGAATIYSADMGVTQFAPDGVLGLAFPSYSDFHGRSPLFHTLFTEGKMYYPMFSLKLTESGGELFIGGANGAHYVASTLTYTPVTYPVLWQLTIDKIKVDNRVILRKVPALIDTGANFIYGNAQQVLDVHRAAGGGRYMPRVRNGFQSHWFTFPCNTFPTVTFTIGRRDFSLSPRVLSQGPVETSGIDSDCFSGIAVVEEKQEFWTIGTIFLQQFYTVLDFNSYSPRVGFAELQVQGGASES